MRDYRAALDLLDLAEREGLNRARELREQERRAERLAARDRPVDELPQLGRLRRARRHDHVGEGRDRVGVQAGGPRRVDDLQLGQLRHLLGQRRERRGDPAQARRRVLAGAVANQRELKLVLDRVGDVDVCQRARRAPDDARDARAAAGTRARRPVDARVEADLVLPPAADRRQVLGEVVGRARAVGAVNRCDLEIREVESAVQASDRLIVPAGDLAHVDVRERRPVELQPAAEAGEVVRDRRCRQRPGNDDAALARRQLVGRERRVGRAEVDGARRDGGDARARSGGRIGDRDPVGLVDLGNPLRDQRERERRPGPDEPLGVRCSGRGLGPPGNERDRRDAHERERECESPLGHLHLSSVCRTPLGPSSRGVATGRVSLSAVPVGCATVNVW